MTVNNWKVGSYIWTASAAGWFVLYIVTHVIDAALVSIGCGVLAYVFCVFAELEAEELGDTLGEGKHFFDEEDQ